MFKNMHVNKFKVLAEEENEYEDQPPYNLIENNGGWRYLKPSPIGRIIETRFSVWYNGKLTWRELNSIKEKMDNAKKELNDYESKVRDKMWDIKDSIYQQKRLCKETSSCSQRLDEHLKVCDSTYKCKKNFVAYECQFKENGRCSHYYEIEELERNLEDYEYDIDQYHETYVDLQVTYERNLAIKEDRYEEYKQQMEDDFDDWNYEVSMRVC
jgi:hypothetical protein